MTNHEKAIKIAEQAAEYVMMDVSGLVPSEDDARISGARCAVHVMAAWMQPGCKLCGTATAALSAFDMKITEIRKFNGVA